MKRTGLSAALSFCVRLAMVPSAVGLVHAQTVAPTSTVAGQQVASDEQLSGLLTGLGFEPKALKHGFLVSTKQDGWTLYIQVRLSDDKTKMGMNANLGQVDEEHVSGLQWRALLAANEDIDPSVFYYNKDAKKLYIHRVLDNRAITPAFLKDQIDKFSGNIRGTKELWSFIK